MGKKTGKVVNCQLCGKEHYRSGWQLKIKGRYFCSKACAGKGHSVLLTKKEYKTVQCPQCKEEFKQHWKGPKKFCSTSCSSKYQLIMINSKGPKKKGTKPEKAFADLLSMNEVEFTFQYPVPWKKGWKKWYDFYIPKLNLLIEIDGTYWHGRDVKTSELNLQQWNTRKNDRLKNYLARVRGYKLKRIWSSDIKSLNYTKLKKILDE